MLSGRPLACQSKATTSEASIRRGARWNLDEEIVLMGKCVTNVWEAHGEVWAAQGRERTPEFCKTILGKAIFPVIETRKASSVDLLENHTLRTRSFVDFSPSLAELNRATERLKAEWGTKIEIEARELEHKEGISKTPHSNTRQDSSSRQTARHRRPQSLSQRRAATVAKIINERNVLKRQMHNVAHYEKLRKQHPNFLSFRIADRVPDLKERVSNLQDHRGLVNLALDLAASHHNRQLSTIRTDWKKHKPSKFRRSTE